MTNLECLVCGGEANHESVDHEAVPTLSAEWIAAYRALIEGMTA